MFPYDMQFFHYFEKLCFAPEGQNAPWAVEKQTPLWERLVRGPGGEVGEKGAPRE